MKIAIPVYFGEDVIRLNNKYLEYIKNAGYIPVIVNPFYPQQIGECQGLILPGGVDIDPTYYRQDNYESRNCNRKKDNFERECIQIALSCHIPIFGICRGFQLLFLEYLEKLNLRASAEHQEKILDLIDNIKWQQDMLHSQSDQISRDSYLHRVASVTEQHDLFVNSLHHQGFFIPDSHKKKIHPLTSEYIDSFDIKIDYYTLYGTKNKGIIIEGITIENQESPISGVQWHPEELNDIKLIQDFFGDQKQLTSGE